jgi:WbqC-like protein family
MKIAIMQPYFLPYIGYFQLINAVDKFLLYDIVTFIKGGWINRNRIIVNNTDYMFSIPLVKASPNKNIADIFIKDDLKWKNQLLKTIEQSYKKAPYFEKIFPLISSIINKDETNLSKFILNSFQLINNYLDINTEIIPSANQYKVDQLKGADKVIQICKEENADIYINAINGRKLYDKESFSKQDLSLFFIDSQEIKYQQFKNDFLPNLSILDVLMFNSKEQVKEYLNKYELV